MVPPVALFLSIEAEGLRLLVLRFAVFLFVVLRFAVFLFVVFLRAVVLRFLAFFAIFIS